MADDKYLQNRQLAYDLLKQEGYTDIGDSAEELFKNRGNSELAYNLLSKAGYTDIGKDYNEFANMLYGPEQETKPKQQTRASRFNEMVRQRDAARTGQEPSQGTPVDQKTEQWAQETAARRSSIPQRVAEQQAQAQQVESEFEPVSEPQTERSVDGELAELRSRRDELQGEMEFVKEYEDRMEADKKRNQMVSGVNPLSGVAGRGAEAKWLDENKARYQEAKRKADEVNGRIAQIETQKKKEEVAAKRAANKERFSPSEIVSRGITPFGNDNTGGSESSKDYANTAAADEIYGMAEQTLNQGSKYDEGYKGNPLEQLWTASRQFVEGGVNNIDRGSLTFGLSEGSALKRARDIGEKKNDIINSTIKDMGYTEESAGKLMRSVNEDGQKLNELVNSLKKEQAEIVSMEATLAYMQKTGDKGAASYRRELDKRRKEYDARVKELEPLSKKYEDEYDELESLQSAVEAATDKGLTDSEKSVLDALDEFIGAKMLREEDVSTASAAGAGAEQSAEFALDFILTRGLGKASTKIATKLATRSLMKKLGEKGAKIAARGIADASTSAARTAIMFPRNLSAYGEQLTQMDGGFDDLGRYNFSRSRANAALNTALTQYIEYWSEGFGEYFGAGEQALFKNVTKSAPSEAIGKTLRNYRGSIGKYLDYGKFDGMFNEMLEEVVGSGFNALAGWMSNDRVGDKEAMKEFFAGDNLATLFFSFLPMSAISAGTNMMAYHKMRKRYNDSASALNPYLESGAIDRKELDELASTIAEKTPVEIKDKVVKIADKARSANHGALPKDFAQNLMGYLEGTFAMSLRNDVWEDSQEKMVVVNAYTATYENPDTRAAWDLAQNEQQARAVAEEAGFTQDVLDQDSYILGQKAVELRESDHERANALLGYASAKAGANGLKDGYDEESRQMFNDYESAVRQGLDVNGNIVKASVQLENAPVTSAFIVSPDITVNADGTVTTPTGADGLVTFKTAPDGQTYTAKASSFSGATSEATDYYLLDMEDSFLSTREMAFDNALNTISPDGQARAIASREGQPVYVRDHKGVFEPVVVERMTNGGANVVISGDKKFLQGVALAMGLENPGGSRLEAPITSLYPLLSTDEDGSLTTDIPEGAEQAAAPETEFSPEELAGTSRMVVIDGRPTEVYVEQVNEDGVWFNYEDRNGEIRAGAMPLSSFQKNMVQGEPAVEQEETPAVEAPAEPEPAAVQGVIPVDESTGKKVYDDASVTPEMAYDDLYGNVEAGTKAEENRDKWVIRKSDEANKAVADAEKLVADADAEKAKIDNWDIKDNEDLEDLEKRQNESKAKVDARIADALAQLPELRRKAAFWDELREVADENESARHQAEERKKLEEQYGVDTSGFDLTPQSMEEAIADGLAAFFRGKGLLDRDSVLELVGRNMIPDLRKNGYAFSLSNKPSALPVDKFVMDVMDEYPGLVKDEQDGINMVGELLISKTRKELGDYVFNNRLEEARVAKDINDYYDSLTPEVEAAAETPAEETVEEAPVEEPETPAEEPQAPAEEPVEDLPEDMPEEIVEEAPVEEPEEKPEVPENKPKNISDSPEISVPSQEEREPVVPAAAADIRNAEEARAYFEKLYGKGKRADNSVRVWELTHKAPAKSESRNGMMSQMAMVAASVSGLSEEEAAELVTLGTQLAEDFINDGYVKFPQFFKNLVETFGDGIRPFAKSIYLGASANVSDEIADQMDDRKTVRTFDANVDINDISDEQDTDNVQPEAGGQSEVVAGSPDAGEVAGAPEGDAGVASVPGGISDDTGAGVGTEGELGGEGTAEPANGTDRGGANGTPGGRGRNKGRSNERGGTGRGNSRDKGRRPGSAESTDESAGLGRKPSIEEQEKAATEAEAKAYADEKEAIKDETDTSKLKKLKDELKAKISEITDKVNLDKARMAGQLRAVIERLRDLFSNSANKTERLAQEKVPYQTLSDPEGAHAFGSVVPSGSADAMRDAIKRLEAEEGKSVADFVKDELGYNSLDEMFSGETKTEGLSSEQVDSVGLAIHQMKKGKMFIVGDMTGVGKGRQGAALIRWAKRNGKKVLFVTEKADLFSDMYGDLADIGTTNLLPFIINDDSDANITKKNSDTEEKVVLVRHPGKAVYNALYKSDSDELPTVKKGQKKGTNEQVGQQYDFVMMTYSQAQSARTAEAERKLAWIAKYAKDAIVVMDESHNAAGDTEEGKKRSNRSIYFEKIVNAASGITFMSATFAKRPGNMLMYALRSSMSDAQMTTEDMIQAISEYGIPMQEILASSLFKTGEMVRRERDFSDVKTNWLEPKDTYTEQEIKQARDTFDRSMNVVNSIINFQRVVVDPIVKKLNENFEEGNKAASAALAFGGKGTFREYTVTPYSSQVSNVANLMFYAIKAKKAADMAIEQIKKGEKPVIAVENTLDSYLKDIEGDTNSADFSFVLGRGLARSLNYKYKVTTKQLNKETGKIETIKEESSEQDMGSIEPMMGPESVSMLDALRTTVAEYGQDEEVMPLMLSPIDYIKSRIEAAGYKCGEITGRARQLVQAPDGTYHIEPLKLDKKSAISKFNNGGLDALVLNTAGATGISLHASKRFKDQKKRTMIILQPARDPNTEVQVRGRVDRTGQVSRAEYFYITSPIPAERKVIMMLRQKLASLDANSVGTENVSSNRVNADDMDNKYGDEVARQFLIDHPEINTQLDKPLEQKKGDWEKRDGLLYQLLIGAQRMSCADQEMILEELQNSYKDQIEYLNQNGINDLATTTMNLEAVAIDTGLFIKGKDNESMSEFAHDTNIERDEVNVLNKPLRSSDINERMKKYGALNEDGTIDELYGNKINDQSHAFADKAIAERAAKHRAAEKELEEELRQRYPKTENQTDEEYTASINMIPQLATLKEKNASDEERFEIDMNKQTRAVARATTYLKPGMPVFVPLTDELGRSGEAPTSYGRFMGFKVPKDGKPKGIKAEFATKDSRASIEIPVVSKADVIQNIIDNTYGSLGFSGSNLRDIGGPSYDSSITDEMRRQARDEWWDKMIPKDTNRQIRYMVTGNILQACGSLGKYKGTITTFTRKDPETGEITVERGMLLAEDFDPENFMVRSAVTKDDVWEGYDVVRDNDTNISAQREGDRMIVNFDRKGREKLSNHPIMKDDGFKELVIGNDIDAYSKDRLRAYVAEKNVEKVLEYLYKNYGFTKGHLFVMPDSTERVDAIIYTDKPYQEVIKDFEDKYNANAWNIDNKIRKAIQQYKMDVNNEDLKNRIREMVQLRQAYLRKRYAKGESSRLAWQVIVEDQNIEQAKDDKDWRDQAYARREAIKEELEARGVHGNAMHFESGKSPLETIIKTFNSLNKNETNAKIAKKVFDIAKRLKLDVIMNEKIHNNTGGQTAGDLVEYNWKYMNAEWITDQMKADTILHELIHTATVYAKRLVDGGNEHLLLKDSPEAYDAVLVLNALYDSIRRDPQFTHKQSDEYGDQYTDYGVQDWFEMLSEAGSNENFRDDLKKVKVAPRLVAGFVTFNDVTNQPEYNGRTQTAWEVIEEQMNTLLDHFDQHAYTEMWRGTSYGERSYKEMEDRLYRGGDTAERRLFDAELEATNKTLDSMEEELGVVIHRVPREEMPSGHKSDKGYYNPKTGELAICTDNIRDERDTIATVFHETVGHKGLRELFGNKFNDAMVRIYASLDGKGRAWVNGYIRRHNLKPGDVSIILGMEEYMSHLAEKGDFRNTIWNRIKEILGKVVDIVFGTDGFFFTNRELNYILRASYEHMKNPNWLNTPVGKAKDTLWRRELGINETDPERPTDPDGPGSGILYREGDTASVEYDAEMEKKWNKIVTENQNADLPVKIGIDKIMKEVGKESLSEDEDYIQRHNLSSSRAETEAHDFELFRFAPMLAKVREIQGKLLGDKTGKQAREEAYEKILDYIYAVSGLERNAYKNNEIEQAKKEAVKNVEDTAKVAEIEQKYDSMKKDWSGITSLMGRPMEQWQEAEAEAESLIRSFKAEVKDDAALKELWNRIRACTDYSLEHAYKYGLLTREEFERLHGTASQPRMWNYYVPLRGFSEKTAEEEYGYSTYANPPANGVVVKKMKGRWTKADNPLANILNIAETEIVQGNDNRAKQSLLRFVMNAGKNSLLTEVEPWYVKNPATGKWSVAWPQPQFDETTNKQVGTESLEEFEGRMRALREKGLARQGRSNLRVDNIMANKAHRNEHLIKLKVGGVDKMIWVNGDPAISKAVSGIGHRQSMRMIRQASRVLSNLFTTYSLDFAGKNLIRDTIYSRVALAVKEDRAYRHQFSKNWWKNFGYGAFAFPMMRLAAQWESGKLQTKANPTEREQMFIDFMHDGGQTGYTIINSVSKIKKDLERSMRRAGKDTSATIPFFGQYAELVKTLNEAFELLTRFTAYQTSRDMGRSGQRSASDAKEISVNFNRRGAQSGEGFWGNFAAYLGATHYFYNAGVQGFDNFLRLFKVKPGKMSAITGGFVLMGVLTPLINSMLAGALGGGGGDDEWYWNLPEWVRRNNLIIGEGKWYLAVPLPVEFRAPYGVGDIIGSAFCYDKTPNRTFGSVAGDLISTASGILPVNPVEGYTGNGNLGDAALRAVAPDATMFFVDWATNRDYTGRPLWKENPFSDTVPKSQGAYASTPKGIVNACQFLSKQSAGAVDIPPGLVRDFMNNYGGGFFRAAEDASKILTGFVGSDPDRPLRWDNVPFFSGFTGHIDADRSNSFATNSLREYGDLSDGVVKKLNAVLNTSDVTASMAYDNPESLYDMAQTTIQKARVKKILSSKDYELGKMYRDGMNNKYKMKQRLTGSKAGEWYKSKEIEREGVNTLKKNWKAIREEWASMPDNTPEERSAKADVYLKVQDAWHLYYDAEANLAEQLMDYEYGK